MMGGVSLVDSRRAASRGSADEQRGYTLYDVLVRGSLGFTVSETKVRKMRRPKLPGVSL